MVIISAYAIVLFSNLFLEHNTYTIHRQSGALVKLSRRPGIPRHTLWEPLVYTKKIILSE